MGLLAMMKFSLLLAMVAVVAADNAMSTMPLFSWSAHSDVPKAKSAEAALESAITSGKPEVVIVYMLNEVSTKDMQNKKEAFANLQESLDQAKSSSFAAVPVSKVDIDSLLATAKTHGANGADVESSKLEAYLASHPELMMNDKPDVLVVRFPEQLDAEHTDSVLGAAEKAIAAATNGQHTSILSTTSSMNPGVVTNLAYRFFAGSQQRASAFNTLAGMNSTSDWPVSARTSIYYGGAAYMTPTLAIAILVMIYMGFLALSAYCCILNLQTPEKFEGDQEKDMARALNQGDK